MGLTGGGILSGDILIGPLLKLMVKELGVPG